MPLTLNSTLDRLALSGIRRFSALAAATPGCVSLTLGEPGEATSDAIKAQVAKDLAAGMTHYPPNNGLAELREAIAAHEREQGLAWAAVDQVIVTNGATEALFSTLSTILNPGNEVIVPQPAFGLYASIVTLLGAAVVELDTAGCGFQIAPAALAKAVGDRTKAIVITSPNNPTGCALDAESLAAVADAARRRDFYVICDDVYSELVYTSSYQRFCTAHPEVADRTVVVGSLSKPHAMTGWRLGWAVSSPKLSAQMSKVHQYAVSCLPAFTQRAGVVALAEDVFFLRESYRRRRDLVVRLLGEMGLCAREPDGAFYAFPSVAEFGLTSEEFCERAISEAGVALVPGVFFGAEGFVRLSYACDEDTLKTGLDRLEAFVRSLR